VGRAGGWSHFAHPTTHTPHCSSLHTAMLPPPLPTATPAPLEGSRHRRHRCAIHSLGSSPHGIHAPYYTLSLQQAGSYLPPRAATTARAAPRTYNFPTCHPTALRQHLHG